MSPLTEAEQQYLAMFGGPNYREGPSRRPSTPSIHSVGVPEAPALPTSQIEQQEREEEEAAEWGAL
jgi:hypothetical protein